MVRALRFFRQPLTNINRKHFRFSFTISNNSSFYAPCCSSNFSALFTSTLFCGLLHPNMAVPTFQLSNYSTTIQNLGSIAPSPVNTAVAPSPVTTNLFPAESLSHAQQYLSCARKLFRVSSQLVRTMRILHQFWARLPIIVTLGILSMMALTGLSIINWTTLGKIQRALPTLIPKLIALASSLDILVRARMALSPSRMTGPARDFITTLQQRIVETTLYQILTEPVITGHKLLRHRT